MQNSSTFANPFAALSRVSGFVSDTTAGADFDAPDIVKYSAAATHYRITRWLSGSDKQRCVLRVPNARGEMEELKEFPIAELTPAIILQRWGAGCYRVNLRGAQTPGSRGFPVMGNTAFFVVSAGGGLQKVSEPEADDDDGAARVAAPIPLHPPTHAAPAAPATPPAWTAPRMAPGGLFPLESTLGQTMALYDFVHRTSRADASEEIERVRHQHALQAERDRQFLSLLISQTSGPKQASGIEAAFPQILAMLMQQSQGAQTQLTQMVIAQQSQIRELTASVSRLTDTLAEQHDEEGEEEDEADEPPAEEPGAAGAVEAKAPAEGAALAPAAPAAAPAEKLPIEHYVTLSANVVELAKTVNTSVSAMNGLLSNARDGAKELQTILGADKSAVVDAVGVVTG